MKKPPDDSSIETLLRGTIREPSARFEEALRQIPSREEGPTRPAWLLAMRPLAIAASIIIALTLFLEPEIPVKELVPALADSPQQLDEEWLNLLSLADAVAEAGSLTDAETRLALEFYAFNP